MLPRVGQLRSSKFSFARLDMEQPRCWRKIAWDESGRGSGEAGRKLDEAGRAQGCDRAREGRLYVWSCEPIGPVRGSKSSKSGKEGSRVTKLIFPSAKEKGVLSQKNPHFPCDAL